MSKQTLAFKPEKLFRRTETRGISGRQYDYSCLFYHPPMVIILRFFKEPVSISLKSFVNCPPSDSAFARMLCCINGSTSSPLRNAKSRSVSSFEKRQFFIFPSAVKRMRLQLSQK